VGSNGGGGFRDRLGLVETMNSSDERAWPISGQSSAAAYRFGCWVSGLGRHLGLGRIGAPGLFFFSQMFSIFFSIFCFILYPLQKWFKIVQTNSYILQISCTVS
jgi:hypothetical protein